MVTNLYDLLQLSSQLPPDCQLDGMAELSRDVPASNGHADYHSIVSAMNVFDVELLLDFILYVCITMFPSPVWRHRLLSKATTQQ